MCLSVVVLARQVAALIHESLPYAAGKGFCSTGFLQQAYE